MQLILLLFLRYYLWCKNLMLNLSIFFFMILINLIKFLQHLLNWSEVWAILIPLLILLVLKKQQPKYLLPVILYLWIAFFLNLLADSIADFKKYFPDFLQSNNPLYNIHSIIRFTCFSYYFIIVDRTSTVIFKKIVLITMVIFVLINFIFFEHFFNFFMLSGSLLTVEAFLLLIYCLNYYLTQLNIEVENIATGKNFWIVTGLGIYVVVNFFLFLFYVPMIKENPKLASQMWNVHNVAYIIFCTLIAKSFYAPFSN